MGNAAQAKMLRAGKEDAVPADAFPVKVEAIVSFVRSPRDAFEAITRDYFTGRNNGDEDDPRANNEPVRYSFTYGGVRHDVALTPED